MNTDQIVILEDGKVHCTGRHKELLAHDPIYQEIYRSQMSGEQENEMKENEKSPESCLENQLECEVEKDNGVGERRGE